MDPELKSMLDRADDLLRDLEDEYNKCLKVENVSLEARNITDELLQKLRNVLDQTMNRAWRKYIKPSLCEANANKAKVYFPIAKDDGSFRSILGKGHMAQLDQVHKRLYDFLLAQQPFTGGQNQWLGLLGKITARGKHVELTPQKRKETSRIRVTRAGDGEVSWYPSVTKFGRNVKVMGAPMDPNTQRIVPTPGVSEQVEIWVSFVLEGHGVDALQFCREACQKTRALVVAMVTDFQLQDAG